MKSGHRSFIVALLLFAIILSACQPSSTPTIPAATPCTGDACLPPTLIPTASPAPTITPTVPVGQQRTKARDQVITFWHAYSLNSIDLVNSLVDDFNRTNPDGIRVQVKAFLTDRQLRDALAAIKDASDLPDVIMGEEALLSALDRTNPLPDLTNFIADPTIGFAASQQKSIPQKYWLDVTRNNKIIGIPTQKEVFFLLYNQSWAKELGFEQTPITFEQFSAQTRAALENNLSLKDRTKNGTGGWLINWQTPTALGWLGTDFSIPDDGQKFDQPVLNSTFVGLKQLQLNNNIWLGLNTDPIPYFANRQALFVSSSSRELAEMIIHMDAFKMKDTWTIIPYPQFGTAVNRFTRGSAFGLTAADPGKQIAGWLFIQWMMEPDRQAYIDTREHTIPMDEIAAGKLTDFSSESEIIRALSEISKDSVNYSSSNWYITESILSDGFKQLFLPETTLETIPSIIAEMDKTYAEYHQ